MCTHLYNSMKNTIQKTYKCEYRNKLHTSEVQNNRQDLLPSIVACLKIIADLVALRLSVTL